VYGVAVFAAPVAWAEQAGEPQGETWVPQVSGPQGDELAARIAAAGTSEDHDGADAVVVLDHSVTRVEPSGQSHTVRRRVIKVLTEAGAADLSRLHFDYDPATMEVEVRVVRVVRPDGAPVEVDTGDAADVPQPGHWIYWGLRTILLQVPRPRVGDAVETVVYRTGFQIAYLDEEQDRDRFVPPMRGHFYDIVLFGEDAWPCREQRYEVTTPRDKPLLFEISNGPVLASSTVDDQGFHYAFWREDLPAFEQEPGAPYASDSLPKVVMATVPDWPAKSRWFFHVNERQFEPNDEIRAMVRHVTEGLRTDEERVTALVRWVARFIRYRGLSMGEGEGYTLHPGDMTFEHRAGVCKDIASMLITMMRAAGYTVYPAMTMAGARVERIAADQFNHSVVAWEQADGSFRMLDPTWAPLSRQVWSNAEREQHYLVGTPEGEELSITTPQGPEHNELVVQGHGRLAADGSVVSTVTVSASGYLEDRLRRLFGFGPALETSQIIGIMARAIAPQAEVEAHGLDDVLDLDRPFGVRFRYHAEGYAQPAGSVLRLVPPLGHNVLVHPRLSQHLDVTGSTGRTQPLLLRCAATFRTEERLDLPVGYDLVAPVRRSLHNGAGSFEAAIEQQGRQLVLTMRLVLDRRRYTASEYAAVRALADAQRALARTAVILRREEVTR
jgi:hypothetical protein